LEKSSKKQGLESIKIGGSEVNKTKIDWCGYMPHTRNPVYTKQGYVLVWCPEHPNANKGKIHNRGYIFEHRLVMSNMVKRSLTKNDHIHHINGIKSDNRIENLELMTNSGHRKEHWKSKTEYERKRQAIHLNKYQEIHKFKRSVICCACGCGEKFIDRDNKGRLRKYIQGHNTKNTHWKWGCKVV
jgi:hypothetical protein